MDIFSDLCTMSLTIASLNSGSNGNCYYIGNEQDAVLIDAGISCRETGRRMEKLGLSLHNVRGIFISHEHSDHIRGVEVLSRKHRIPVFMAGRVSETSWLWLDHQLLFSFSGNEPVSLGSLTIHPFSKPHDSIDPYSFSVTGNGSTVGVYTDIGRVEDELISHFNRCNAVFLEANYDETMLEQGRYPRFLKQRISGGSGHLSNRQALDLFLQHRSPALKWLLLSHLSAENNDPQLLRDLFAPHANGTRIEIASRYRPSAVISL